MTRVSATAHGPERARDVAHKALSAGPPAGQHKWRRVHNVRWILFLKILNSFVRVSTLEGALIAYAGEKNEKDVAAISASIWSSYEKIATSLSDELSIVIMHNEVRVDNVKNRKFPQFFLRSERVCCGDARGQVPALHRGQGGHRPRDAQAQGTAAC